MAVGYNYTNCRVNSFGIQIDCNVQGNSYWNNHVTMNIAIYDQNNDPDHVNPVFKYSEDTNTLYNNIILVDLDTHLEHLGYYCIEYNAYNHDVYANGNDYYFTYITPAIKILFCDDTKWLLSHFYDEDEVMSTSKPIKDMIDIGNTIDIKEEYRWSYDELLRYGSDDIIHNITTCILDVSIKTPRGDIELGYSDDLVRGIYDVYYDILYQLYDMYEFAGDKFIEDLQNDKISSTVHYYLYYVEPREQE